MSSTMSAAVRVEIVLAQQTQEAVQRRLAAVARVLDACRRRRSSGRGRGAQHLPRRNGAARWRTPACVPPRRVERVPQRVLAHHHVRQLGKDVGLGEEMPRIARRGGASGPRAWRRSAPEVLAHRARAGLVEAERALQERVDLVVHRREDVRPRVVQRVVEVEDPHPPRRRQPRDPHLLASDQRADAFVGQDFQQQRVRDAAVDDVHALDAVCARRRAPSRSWAACRRRSCRSANSSSIFFGVRPVSSLPSLSSTPACW